MAFSVRKELSQDKRLEVATNQSANLVTEAVINAVDQHGETALSRAVCLSGVDEIKALIEGGADVNASRADGFTPLLLAIFFGKLDVVRLLIESGADPKATTRFGTTALIWANARGFHQIADYLEQHQAATGVRKTEPKVSVEPLVIRKLSEPLPIWDLVHETSSNFRPTSAFFSRITASKLKTAVVMLTVLLVLVAGVVAARKLNINNEKSNEGKSFAQTVSQEQPRQIEASDIQSGSSQQALQSEALEQQKGEDAGGPALGQSSGNTESGEGDLAGVSRYGKRANARGSVRRVESSVAANSSEADGSDRLKQPTDSGSNQVGAETVSVSNSTAAQKLPNSSKSNPSPGNSQVIEHRSAVPTAKAKTIQWP